jgi:hypothetical protein
VSRRNVAVQAQTSDGPVLAIVGVTGAVGQEFLRVRPPILSLSNTVIKLKMLDLHAVSVLLRSSAGL